jgi:hypothetical protein
LIVQNEQERLVGALESLAFCDERIVVDGGSSDRTVEIARAAGATVIENPWPGFAAQRNRALDAASSEWILEVDGDERISAELRASIEALLEARASEVEMAVCPLRNRFLGGPLGPSAKYPAYRARMFRRGAYRHDEARMVHEGIEPRRRPYVLEGDLEHELAGTLREAVGDAWRYARLESRHLARPSGPGAYLAGIVLRPAAKFLYRTFLEGGWRDGWRGLLKISLDVTSDALVWLLVLLRRGSEPAQRAAGSEHFGRRPNGAVKIVAIAGGEKASLEAHTWLEGLGSHGLDVALISAGGRIGQGSGAASGQNGGNVEVHELQRLSPVAVMRALDVEMQLRTTDGVITVGRRARLLRRLLPGTLRPEIPHLSAVLEPASAAELANETVARG